uniref:Arrestin C-terminal-like domain-containing protein n=1 Tax=Glossina morsitans morsitans TaxID=37546 RepID=A0A1B0FBG2_GLOMM
MSSKCTILFDNNPFGVYYAGQEVSGKVELITTRPKTVRGIIITVSGFAEVRWTEHITKQDTHGERQKTIETYSASEIYYSNERYVYGQSGGTQMVLAAGKYVFPFQTIIPPNAPTSLNGAWGQIHHEVSVVVDRVMRYNNIFKQPYTVIVPHDLNLNPSNVQPLHKIDEKVFCWSLCCGNQGPMVMEIKVPYASCTPGQKVHFNIILNNQSDVHCSDVKVRLMKKEVYTSRSPETKTKETEIKIADNHCGEVIKRNKAEFNEYLQIPSTIPTLIGNCNIIKVHYTLKFIAKVSRIHRDLIIEFPFTIGTWPVYASIMSNEPITNQPINNFSRLVAPPTYEEDVRSEQFENNTFKPRYPVFLNDGTLAAAALSPSNNSYPTPYLAPKSPLTYSACPTAPPSALALQTKHEPATKGHVEQPQLEVLGFSLPPGYETTSTNIGWK